MISAVSDAGPLIHLYECGALSLLEVFSAVHVPEAVWRETVGKERIPEAALNEGIHHHRSIEVAELSDFVAAHRLEHLHSGEQECLCVCYRDGIPILLTDDLAARDADKKHETTPVGSLGIVVRACRVGRITLAEAEQFIHYLQRTSSLFVTPMIVDLALEQLRRLEPR